MLSYVGLFDCLGVSYDDMSNLGLKSVMDVPSSVLKLTSSAMAYCSFFSLSKSLDVWMYDLIYAFRC